IELLTATAIVALLIGLLLPSLTAARQSANDLKCRSNLRQWAVAAILYAHDNEGFLPRRGQGVQPTSNIDRPEDWFNALPPLLGQETYCDLVRAGHAPRPGDRSIWMCPSAASVDAANYLAYGMNMWLSTWQASQPDRLDAVGPVERQVFMADGPGGY